MSALHVAMLAIIFLMNLINTYKLFTDCKIKEQEEKNQKKVLLIYSVFFIVLNLVITVFFCFYYKEHTFLFSLKRLTLLGILWPIGYIDFKTYRIPNAFILLSISYRVVILVLELIFAPHTFPEVLISEGIAAGVLLLSTLLCSILIKNSIGYGDIKLFAVMGLFLGIEGIWNAVFISLIAVFIVSVILLLTKKKAKKDFIPFAPCIVVGTYISIILTGM